MMAEEDSPSSSLLSPGSASGTVDAAVTGLSLLSLTPSTSASRRSRRSVRQSGMKPKRLFGVTAGLGEASSTGIEVTDAAAPFASSRRPPPWTVDEIRALVSFMLLYTEGDTWQSRASKTDRFWEEAGSFIQRQVNSTYSRTGWYYTSVTCI